MKINVKKTDCKFIVKPEERMVICVIDRVNDRPLKFLVEEFVEDIDATEMDTWMLEKLRNKIAMPSSFMGKAVCSSDDEWNEELGRKIAYSRAKHKFYMSFFKRANLYVQAVDRRLNDIMNRFNELGETLSENQDKLEEEIERLTKE